MSVDVTEARAKSLSERVAAQIRAVMGYNQIRQSVLARRMGVTEQWLSVRLRGVQPIDLNDLEQIASALGVGVETLMSDRMGVTNPLHSIPRQRRSQMVRNIRPSDRRPAGRSAAVTGPSGSRRPVLIRE